MLTQDTVRLFSSRLLLGALDLMTGPTMPLLVSFEA